MTWHSSAGSACAAGVPVNLRRPARVLGVFKIGLAFEMSSAQRGYKEQIPAGQLQTGNLLLPDGDDLSGAVSRHSSRMTV